MTTKHKNLIVPAVLAGIVLAIAVIYWVVPAGSLPSFFPGHEAGLDRHYFKHGVASFAGALGCFVFAWFQKRAERSDLRRHPDVVDPISSARRDSRPPEYHGGAVATALGQGRG